MAGTMGAAFIWVLGVVGSGWCFTQHICMGGHMEHPPYPIWHYAMDAGWMLGVIAASFWVRRLRVPLGLALAALSAFLVAYRLVFGSFGGRYEWLPL